MSPANSSLETNVLEAIRSFGVAELAVIRCEGGVVLEGSSPTFYGKQMAQELARKADLIVVSNRITVQATAPTRGRFPRAP
jgi:hypothetical protein